LLLLKIFFLVRPSVVIATAQLGLIVYRDLRSTDRGFHHRPQRVTESQQCSRPTRRPTFALCLQLRPWND